MTWFILLPYCKKVLKPVFEKCLYNCLRANSAVVHGPTMIHRGGTHCTGVVPMYLKNMHLLVARRQY